MTTISSRSLGLLSSHVSAFVGHLLPTLGSLTWLALYIVRTTHHDPSVQQDMLLALCFNVFGVYKNYLQPEHLSEDNTFAICHILSSLTAWAAIHALRQHKAQVSRSETSISPNLQEQSRDPWAKPLIFPCRTTHTRFFPNKHSFSYSYLFVGIPVGWRGRLGSMLSADVVDGRRGWYHVDAADYLERDVPSHLGLRGKLDHYLVGQGIDPKEFPHVYLATAPRVLGYSFNPVSFWYLYSIDRELKAMILEVNNTFDERRIYYLAAPPEASGYQQSSADEINLASSGENGVGPARFTSAWEKDFHVSPFNSRDGSYTLSASDPRPPPPTSASKSTPTHPTLTTAINNTITLLAPPTSSSTSATPKLVARVFSTSPAIDPSSHLSPWKSIYYLLRYGWSGFFTSPRIIREAASLFFAKKLTVWFRPEVLNTSISRHATDGERTLEKTFHHFLASRLQSAKEPLTLTYHPAADTGPSSTFHSPLPTTMSAITKPSEVTLTILTPAFYARFPHHPSFATTLLAESTDTDIKNRTLSVSPPSAGDALARLLDHTIGPRQSKKLSATEAARWKCMTWLRCPPPGQAYEPAASPSVNAAGKMTPLDEFVLAQLSHEDATKYRRAVTKLFLAARFAGGFDAVVGVVDFAFRVGLVWVGFGGNLVHVWGWVKGW